MSRRRRRSRTAAPVGAWRIDLRYALRSILRRPGYSLLVSGTLALGLGLALSSFAVFEAALVRPLPFQEGERLVSVWQTRNGAPTRWGEMSWLDLMDLRASTATFASVGGHTVPATAALAGASRPSLVSVIEVTPGFFETLGLHAERGRLFEAADHDAGGVALVSHDVWIHRFGADAAAIGRVVRLDDEPVRIVGVLPREARYYPDGDVGFWLPYAPAGQSRGSRNLLVIGRLAEGDGVAAADAEMRALAAGLEAAHPASNAGMSARVHPLAEQMMGPEMPRVMALLLAATLAVLLLAGANVAGLVLARARERHAETAVLVSLGASRARLLAPLALEGLLLAAAGGAAATLIARWLPAVVLAHAPLAVPRAAEVGLDGRVFAAAAVGAVTIACLASVAPAWSVARGSLRTALGAGRATSPERSVLHAREALVVGQMAGALTLLTAAGLTLRSVERLTSVDPGFDAAHLAQVSVRLEPARYPRAAAVFGFHDALLAALSGLPGVERTAAVSMVPFGGGGLCDALAPEGRDPVTDCVQYRSVTPGYFATMGIPVLSGREVTEGDEADAPRVAVLSRSAAALAFPGGDAVGSTIEAREDRWRVVGVVEDSRLADLASDPPPVAYLPFRQSPFRLMTAVVRAKDPEGVASTLPGTVWGIDPDLAIRDAGTLSRLVSSSAAGQRFRSALFGAAGAVGLFLAMLGVGGLLLQLVQQRRREIGVRMALGSSRAAVVGSVLRRAMVPTALGACAGIGGSLLAGRLLRGFLFGVSAYDPATLLTAVGGLALAALLAAAIPARRAAGVDPARTLRDE